MPTNYEKGRLAEYKCIKDLEANGFTCMRSAGSKGKTDVHAYDINRHKLIQVKSLSNKKGCIPPFTKEVQELTEQKKRVPFGTAIELWVLRKNKWIKKISI